MDKASFCSQPDGIETIWNLGKQSNVQRTCRMPTCFFWSETMMLATWWTFMGRTISLWEKAMAEMAELWNLSENPEMGWYNVLMVGPNGSFGCVFFLEFLRNPKIDSFIWSLFAASETIHVFLRKVDWNKAMPQCRRSGCRSVKGMIVLRSVEVLWSYGHIVSSIHPKKRVGSKFVKTVTLWHREHLPKVSSSQFFLPSKWILTHFSNFHGLPPQRHGPALPSCHEKRLCRHPVLRHHCHVSDRGRCWPPDRVRDAVSRTGAFSVSAEMAGNGTIVLCNVSISIDRIEHPWYTVVFWRL